MIPKLKLDQESFQARQSAVDDFMNVETNSNELTLFINFLDTEAEKVIDPKFKNHEYEYAIEKVASIGLLKNGFSDVDAFRGAILAENFFMVILMTRNVYNMQTLVEAYRYPDNIDSPVSDWNTIIDIKDAYNMMYVIIETIRQEIKDNSGLSN